ncbi:MAG TPA: acyl-CoA dehydrogenase family protein [Solirubrobacterales bacterium]|jgi:acyl-CoA dehydrogenase|nr:acyl-CoA dehydrogenase family protein [Solirubrobacterales bacterium]
MINLEIPKKFKPLVSQANQVATEVFRPISRKYDEAEHSYPKELDMLASLIDGMSEGSDMGGAGAAGVRRESNNGDGDGNRNGSNLSTVLGIIELCWGDVGLLLSMPRQGLGNSAIASVATEEQLERYGGKWAAMAITEPEAGSDSAAIRTTAELDGDEYVLNGEKIFVTSGDRADLIVVWATLDRSVGRAAIKSFIVERDNPGLKLDRLEHKLGIRASDTANFTLQDCRVPVEALLGSSEVEDKDKQGFGGAMQTFDNTRPLVAAMAVGVARASLEETRKRLAEAGVEVDYSTPALSQHAAAARFLEMEADYEAAWLLTLQAAWMADNGKPNSLQASMAKAKAGRTCVDVALGCVELCGSVGYGENELLEKWARDAKILDIFEGTQQIQLLIVARQLLGKSSAELR